MIFFLFTTHNSYCITHNSQQLFQNKKRHSSTLNTEILVLQVQFAVLLVACMKMLLANHYKSYTKGSWQLQLLLGPVLSPRIICGSRVDRIWGIDIPPDTTISANHECKYVQSLFAGVAIHVS